jgi:hypothetical protein
MGQGGEVRGHQVGVIRANPTGYSLDKRTFRIGSLPEADTAAFDLIALALRFHAKPFEKRHFSAAESPQAVGVQS